MKKIWKALKGGSPAKNGYNRKENGGGGGGSGTESLTGKGPPSLHDGTIYTSALPQQQPLQQVPMQPDIYQQNMVPPLRVNLPARSTAAANGAHHQQLPQSSYNPQQSTPASLPQHAATAIAGAESSQQQHVVYVNEQGHRVTATTVRVPPPPPAPPSSPATIAAAAQQQQVVMQQQQAVYGPTGTLVTNLPPQIVRQHQQQGGDGSASYGSGSDPIQLANETTRTLVKKFIADIWNRGEIDLIPEVCSPNLRFNGNTGFDRIGHDGLARMVATIRDALDEYHCEIHSMVVEHNKAFCRLRFTGKHSGPLLGYPPTGKVVAWMGATEFTCQNGKILKVWELGDVKSLEEQLQPSSSPSGGGGGGAPLEEDEI